MAAPLALKAVSYESDGPSLAPVDGSTVSTTVPESPTSLQLPAGESGDRRGNIGPVTPESTTTETVYGSIGTPTSVPVSSTAPTTTPTTAAPPSSTSTTAASTSTTAAGSTTSSSTSTSTTVASTSTTSTSTTAPPASSTLPSTTPPAG